MARMPLAVQVGFAGSRHLFDAAAFPDLDPTDVERQVLSLFIGYLAQLPATLGLTSDHFLCGVSQIAVGADTVFVRACQSLKIVHRVLLSQPRDAFLSAKSSDGTPDFSSAEQNIARSLLASPLAIEEHAVSSASDRHERFQDANLAILGASDVVVCLQRERPGRDAGGTGDLMERAISSGKPTLEITVTIVDGRATLSGLPALSEWKNGENFKLPELPTELLPALSSQPTSDRPNLPDAAAFLERIRVAASARARQHSGWFKRGAMVIIVFHIVATLLAVLALKFHEHAVFALLLALELVFLVSGLSAHLGLHRSESARVWAVCRLVAEIMRSLRAVERSGGTLDYPLTLTWDDGFVPLLRTCAILGLRSRRLRGEVGAGTTAECRVRYLTERLSNPENGQISYYEREARHAAKRLRYSNGLFWLCSGGAIVATATKLLAHNDFVLPELASLALGWGGPIAVGLPVAAVGFLSWAAAGDLPARSKTYAAMRDFLIRQARFLVSAQGDRELAQIVRETETRLLSENLHWFSRHSFITVA